jgi:hypothetical protein
MNANKCMVLLMMREASSVKDKNVQEYAISKREKKKLHIVNHTLSCSFWNVSDFAKNLRLGSKGLHVHKEITMSLVFDNEITYVFGVRQPSGWKVNINECVIAKDYETLLKLYEDVYTHPPSNDDYPSVFLCSWLAQWKRLQVNWAQYAHHTTQQQLKRATTPVPCGRPKLSSTITMQSMQFESETPMQLSEEGGQDEECFIVEGKKAMKIAMVKKLGKIANTEHDRNPMKLVMFEEK